VSCLKEKVEVNISYKGKGSHHSQKKDNGQKRKKSGKSKGERHFLCSNLGGRKWDLFFSGATGGGGGSPKHLS